MKLAALLAFAAVSTAERGWVEKSTIRGEDDRSRFGSSFANVPGFNNTQSRVVVVGAPFDVAREWWENERDGDGRPMLEGNYSSPPGRVRIYAGTGQLGPDLVGNQSADSFGVALAATSICDVRAGAGAGGDEDIPLIRVAVAAKELNLESCEAQENPDWCIKEAPRLGVVRVYDFAPLGPSQGEPVWKQVGSDIIYGGVAPVDVEALLQGGEGRLDKMLALSKSGQRLVIGAPFYSRPAITAPQGSTFVYDLSPENEWVLAAELEPEERWRTGYGFGTTVALSEDGLTVAVRADVPRRA